MCSAPQSLGAGSKPVAHVAGKPCTAHQRGNGAALESLRPFIRPDQDFGIKFLPTNLARQIKCTHKARRVHQHIRMAVEVKPFSGLDAGANHNVFHVGGVGHQVSTGGGLDLYACSHVAVPRLGQLGFADTGLGQQIDAVQQGAGADVTGRSHHCSRAAGGLLKGISHIARLKTFDVIGFKR